MATIRLLVIFWQAAIRNVYFLSTMSHLADKKAAEVRRCKATIMLNNNMVLCCVIDAH